MNQLLTKKYLVPFSIILILALGLFVRVYRTDMLLRFYYDQGRDALVIRDMVHNLKPVLVGPTTGLAGIMRGPAFYYLLLPAYLVGRGDPVIAAAWLQIINTFGLFVIFLIGRKIHSPLAGLLAALLVATSRNMVDLSRWLSNPSPILTSVPIMVYALLRLFDHSQDSINDKHKSQPKDIFSPLSQVFTKIFTRTNEKLHPLTKHVTLRDFWWYTIALMLGLNLQFEIASEIWFIPAFALLLLFYPQIRPTRKAFLVSSAIFLATLVPQVVFDLRHGGIMRLAIINNFAASKEPTFTFTLAQVQSRFWFYIDSFSSMFIPGRYEITISLLALLVPLLLTKTRKLLLPLLILMFTPLLILLFYSGNEGNFYSYYLIGLFPIFMLITALGLGNILTNRFLFFIPAIILFLFAKTNFTHLYYFLIAGVDGPEHISLGNQIQAIDWIYQTAGDTPFNVDVYVPPVIPYAYDYLIPWYGQKTYQRQPDPDMQPLLFTLSEVDPPMPSRHQAWLDRQSHIGEIKEYAKFGGIWVEKRTRIPVKSKQ